MKKWIIRISIGLIAAASIFGFGYAAFYSMPGDLEAFEKQIGGTMIKSNFQHRVSRDVPYRRGSFEVTRTFLVEKPIAKMKEDLKKNLSPELYRIRIDRVGMEFERLFVQLWPNESRSTRTRSGAISMYPGRPPSSGQRTRFTKYVDLDKYTTVTIIRNQYDADPIAYAIDHFQRLGQAAQTSLNPPKPPAKTTTVTIEK